jgi:hypothetical protein
MSGDFDDDGTDFFAGDETPPEDRPLGLVVPHVARIIFDAQGEVVFDEVLALEGHFRKTGALIRFIEEDEPKASLLGARA